MDPNANRLRRALILLVAMVFMATGSMPVLGAALPASDPSEAPDLQWFFEAAGHDQEIAEAALSRIEPLWKDGYAAMFVDLVGIFAGRKGNRERSERLIVFLEEQTHRKYGLDLDKWRQWLWSLPYEPHPYYAYFKGVLYGAIDPRMKQFFGADSKAEIRLDQIEWGGVKVNGIPPLDFPKVVDADDAGYLKSSDRVFGLVVDGQARAYPKRIVGWHELVRDRLGGTELTLVYCTLCGTFIPYDSETDGSIRRFGTSGLLYRSNKLLFDEETNSLWSTLRGEPVVGPLVGSGDSLRSFPIVTTTWGEWTKIHPATSVLSLETGFKRDYREGMAYREYFSTDELMFQVPQLDKRLKNKEEVLVLRLQDSDAKIHPVALTASFLGKHRVYHLQAAGENLVFITSKKGAIRVYEAGEQRFEKQRGDSFVLDATGRRWKITEGELVLEDDPQTTLARIAAQRAFWFAWYAQYPDTVLVK